MARQINLLAQLKVEFAALQKLQNEHKNILNYLPSELKTVIQEAKTTLVSKKSIIKRSDSETYPFWKLYEAFNKKCTEGTLESAEAKQLITSMKADLQKTVKFHNNMLSDLDLAQDPEEKQKMSKAINDLKDEIRTQKEALESLNMDCVIGDKPDPALDTVSENTILNTSAIDEAYEEVIEQGIRMKTGPSPTIATDYEKALDDFNSLYEGSSDEMKTKWKRAKDEVEKDKEALQEKLDKAKETTDQWKQQMTANGSRGYYRYAEGVIDGQLVRRMDWEMQSSGAMLSNRTNTTGEIPEEDKKPTKQDSTITQGNLQGTQSIFIEKYTLSADSEGNLIYTPTGSAPAMTGRMVELAAKLSSPFYADEQSYDMKPGDGRDFSGNEAHSDKKSSILIRTADKPIPTSVEIPDWTDGKIQTMIDDYERDCAAGMVPEYARELKQRMQDEILSHQSNLINQLETIHTENGEEKETAILLDIWKKKMSTWQDVVNSLGEDCMVTPTTTDPCTDFETPYDTHVDLCNQNMLPKSLADRFKATMQDCIDSSETSAKSKEAAISTYKSIKGWESNPTTKAAVEKLQNELDVLNNDIADQKSRLAALPPSCFEEINVLINYSGGSNQVTSIPASTITQLQNLTNVLAPNPSITITIQGNAGGNDNIDSDPRTGIFGGVDDAAKTGYSIPNEHNLTVGDVRANPDRYSGYLNQFTDTTNDSVILETVTWGDLAMIRAHHLREYLLTFRAPDGSQIQPNQIQVTLGNVNAGLTSTIVFN